jgi:hypothetical protein
MSKTGALDQLQQVQELNRAFLGLLQARVRQRRSCLKLPPVAEPVLAAAPSSLLDGVAGFPRALFQAELRSPHVGEGAHAGADFDEAEHDLSLSILIAARAASRQSSYQARLLFGLQNADVTHLGAAPLADLQRLACLPGVLRCALSDRQWFWHGLFTTTRPELRRQLTLMALQPVVAMTWPQRRPPHASA